MAEQNETLKNCLKMYSENNLSKETSEILSTLIDKHHKSLNNFEVAGSSLEASSKVYGLSVDSIHTDMLRMSGLNELHFIEQDEEVEDAADQGQLPQEQANVEKRVEREKGRKELVTVTKNKETINAPLDTIPFPDPIFAKFNSIAGSINSSSRLLQNILHSSESELGLGMDKPFWDSEPWKPILYPEEYNYSELPNIDATDLEDIELEDYVLRPNHTGYIISDTPAEQDKDNKENAEDFEDDRHNSQMAVASTSSTLEYSYRPLDKISQFCAGPSHCKFKSLGKSSIKGLRQSSLPKMKEKSKTVIQRGTKFRGMPVLFEEKHEELFQTLDENSNQMREAKK